MSNQKSEIVTISSKDLSLVEGNALNPRQLEFVLKRTAPKYIKERPAKGGGKWKYVEGNYIRKVLNLMFGWRWNFEVVEFTREGDEVMVLGKLTVTTADGEKLTKMQFGSHEIQYKYEDALDDQGRPITYTKDGRTKTKRVKSNNPLSLGNDYKAATTDAMKKCAVDLGIAMDVYSKDDGKFEEIKIQDSKFDKLVELFAFHEDGLSTEYRLIIKRAIESKNERMYDKLIKDLEAIE